MTTTTARHTLGTSDLRLSSIGFGAWAIGGGDWRFGWGAQDDTDSIAAIRKNVPTNATQVNVNVNGVAAYDESEQRRIEIERLMGEVDVDPQ